MNPAPIAAAPSAPPTAAPRAGRTPPAERLVSLDALRGFDMFWILAGDAVMVSLGAVCRFEPFKFLAGQFEHKAWAGLTFYDLIFPLFIFMSGASLAFALPRIIEQQGRGAAVQRVLVRTLVLLALGIFYAGGFTNPWPNMRLLGVLQRIALAYGAAGLLFCFFKPRALAAWTAAILLGYWALMSFIPIRDIALDKDAMIARLGVAGKPPALELVQQAYAATTTHVTGRFEPGRNVSNHFDFEHLPGRKYDVYWDPEGILSTIPAVATCLLGAFAGMLLRRADLDERQKLARLVVAGCVALAGGWIWHLQFPVVKKIWTSSFVLVAGGWSLLLLALFYYLVDLRRWRAWAQPFIWIGMNAITLYLIASVVRPRVMAARLTGGSVKSSIDGLLPAGSGELIVAVVGALLVFWTARFLYRRQIFLRV